jgi:hypothetical protein
MTKEHGPLCDVLEEDMEGREKGTDRKDENAHKRQELSIHLPQ